MKIRKEVLINREYTLTEFDRLRQFVFNGMGGNVYFMELYNRHSGVIFQRYRNKTYIIPLYIAYMDCKVRTGEGVILKTENPNISTEIWESIKDYIFECLNDKIYQK